MDGALVQPTLVQPSVVHLDWLEPQEATELVLFFLLFFCHTICVLHLLWNHGDIVGLDAFDPNEFQWHFGGVAALQGSWFIELHPQIGPVRHYSHLIRSYSHCGGSNENGMPLYVIMIHWFLRIWTKQVLILKRNNVNIQKFKVICLYNQPIFLCNLLILCLT